MGSKPSRTVAEIEAERTIEPRWSRADEQSMSHFATDLEKVAHALPDAVVMLDTDGTVSWLNKATLDLMGIMPLDWLGASLHDLVHQEDRPDSLEKIGTNVHELRLRDGQGQWRRLGIRSRRIADGAQPGFVVLALSDAA